MTSRSVARLIVSAGVALLTGTATAHAQKVRYSAEPRASLAWWQIDPHFGHLWATTCPADPTWQPGEGRSPQYYVDYIRRHEIKESGRRDARIPLYPRKRIRYVCKPAVSAVVEVSDTSSLKLIRAQVSVIADSLFTGLDMRDAYARSKVLNTKQYPAIRFEVDSLTAITPGDTLKATAVGTFELRGVRTPMKSPVKVWREGGGIRVQSHFIIPASSLVNVYEMSPLALGMGVRMGQWKDIHMGVDMLLMNPEAKE
ncbi:MAG TPA: YceI family protein [Longimicrobiales bacterium]